jgi:hypothetical protein
MLSSIHDNDMKTVRQEGWIQTKTQSGQWLCAMGGIYLSD